MMAPLWIHEQVQKTTRNDDYRRNLGQRLLKTDDLKAETCMNSVVLSEHKRMFLREKLLHQPQKSMFNIGDFRHNNHKNNESHNNVTVNSSPNRFLEWNEKGN